MMANVKLQPAAKRTPVWTSAAYLCFDVVASMYATIKIAMDATKQTVDNCGKNGAC